MQMVIIIICGVVLFEVYTYLVQKGLV